MVIALVMTPSGLPLAYEALDGNTSDKTTLRSFLDKIERLYGKARRIWLMDRGIPTEAILAEMRTSRQETFYLVGTSRAKVKQYENKWLELPWRKVRESVEVKLYAEEGELYVLAKSEGRQAKENAIRRKKLARLLRKLRAIAAELPETGSVADARGRRKNGRGAGFRIREDHLAQGGPSGDAKDVHISAG
jgi:transposase